MVTALLFARSFERLAQIPLGFETRNVILQIDTREITPGYFEAMGIPLLSGRVLSWSDAASGPPVAIVNREFEMKYFPLGAIGHRLFRPGDSQALDIVGVTGGIRETSVAEEPKPELFLALTQA